MCLYIEMACEDFYAEMVFECEHPGRCGNTDLLKLFQTWLFTHLTKIHVESTYSTSKYMEVLSCGALVISIFLFPFLICLPFFLVIINHKKKWIIMKNLLMKFNEINYGKITGSFSFCLLWFIFCDHTRNASRQFDYFDNPKSVYLLRQRFWTEVIWTQSITTG